MKSLLFTLVIALYHIPLEAAPVRIAISLDPPQDNNAAIIVPTIQALESAFAAQGLETVPLKLPALEKALASKDFDIFLSTSGLARRMVQFGAKDLVTLVSDRFPNPNQAYGSVFIVRRNSPFRELADLKNLRLAANMPGGFYGYQIAMGQLKKSGFQPEYFFSSTNFVGRDLHAVVDAVLKNEADVGTLSSCFLEDAYEPQSFERQNLRVIHAQKNMGPCLTSTSLYPNWSVSTTPTTPAEISRKAAIALLSMPAITGGLRWSIATDFGPTDELFRDLQVGPFEFLKGYFQTEFMHRYGTWLLFGGFAVFALIVFSVLLIWLVRHRTLALTNALRRERLLKIEIRETGDKLLAMQKISLIGQLSSMIAHELRQPLMTIQAFVHGCSKQVESKTIDQTELIDILAKINRQVVRADNLVERVRDYAKNKEIPKVSFSLNEVIEKTCRRFLASGRFSGELKLDCCKENIVLSGVPDEISLAMMNLLKNASEALSDLPARKQKIQVSLTHTNNQALLTIKDNGPTLSECAARALRVPLISSKIEGLGLGLSIVNSIIEHHCGKLSLEELPTGGVIARIVFPLT